MSENINGTAVEQQTEQAASFNFEEEHLAFMSDELNYVISAVYITEIINNHDITHLPKAPAFVKGIINLRGQIIPIVDIRVRMGRPEVDIESEEVCIIVVNVDSISMGLLVDRVSHVVKIKAGDISAPPAANRQEFVSGITNVDGTVYLVLDCEQLAGA